MKLLNKSKLLIMVLALGVSSVFAVASSSDVVALECPDGWNYRHGTCVSASAEEDVTWDNIQMVMNWILAIVGSMALPLIIAGIVLTIVGAKKQSKIKEENKKIKNGKKKKNGMLIAGIIMLCTGVVGLEVFLLSFLIINFTFW